MSGGPPPRRLTVFGGQGFVGRALRGELARRGLDLRVPDRDDIAPPPGGFGTLVWCIGLTADFRTRPFATATAHVGHLARVLEQGAHDRVVYLSSTRLYGGASSTAEDTPLTLRPENPSDLYNATKIAGEALVLSAPGAEGVVVRLSNVVGPGEWARDTFLGAITAQARAGRIELQSAPGSAKDYLWIDDAARALADIALSGRQRIYNLASGRQTAHRDWTEALARHSGCAIAVADGAPDQGFPPIDIGRLAAEFGTPPTDPLTRVALIAGPSAR